MKSSRLLFVYPNRIFNAIQTKKKLGLCRTRYHTRWNKMRYIIMLWSCYTIKWTIFASSSNLILSFISCAFLTFINLILPLLQISLDETHWSKKCCRLFFIWQDRFEMKNERLDETVVQSFFLPTCLQSRYHYFSINVFALRVIFRCWFFFVRLF